MRCLFVLLLAFAAGVPFAQAEEMTMPIGSVAAKCGTDCPARGMSKDVVEKHLGSPVQSRQAVGDPPISRWEYADFTVYFEYDKVIHTVTKK